MTTETRWTPLSVARGSALAAGLAAWRRRKGVDDMKCKAALHEWENEGGTQETPLSSSLARAQAGSGDR